jgi:hypothetical protein
MVKQIYKKFRDGEANMKDTQGWFWTTLFNDALKCYIVQRWYHTYKICIGGVEGGKTKHSGNKPVFGYPEHYKPPLDWPGIEIGPLPQ